MDDPFCLPQPAQGKHQKREFRQCNRCPVCPPTWFEDLAVPKGPTLQTDQGQPQPLHGLKLVIKEEALRKLSLSPGVALRSTQVRLTCVAGVTRKGEQTKETPALAFSSSLFVSGPHSKLHRSPSVTSNGYFGGSSQFARVVKGGLKIHCT